MDICYRCSAPISETRMVRHARYCSKRCREKAYGDKMGIRGSGLGLATSTTGAISELAVCVDLLKRGFEVFRAMSPACSCDLAILKDGSLIRVEVRTMYRNKATGTLMGPKPKDSLRYDLFAMVITGEGIAYDPPLDQISCAERSI